MSTKTASGTAQIPILEISGSLPQTEVAKKLVDAATSFGFVYIRNQGKDIPIEVIDRAFSQSKELFASPIEEKEKCTIQENNFGWSGMHSETLDAENQRVGDFKEAFNIGEFLDGKAQQPLPASLQAHEADLATFHQFCHKLCQKILILFGIGLEIDPSSWFSDRHTNGPTASIFRLLYYPSIPASPDFQPTVDIRAGAHSDYGSITLLFQRPGQPGLEILPPSSNTSTPSWQPVLVSPPTTESDLSPPILVNIGDLLSYWTCDLLKSTVHRVVFPIGAADMGDRYSIAYFCHPVGETVLEPVPSERVSRLRREGEERKRITAQEHLQARLKGSYLGMYRDEA